VTGLAKRDVWREGESGRIAMQNAHSTGADRGRGKVPVNQGPADCCICGAPIPPMGGLLIGRRGFAHLSCRESGKSEVTTVRTSGGTFTQNRKGRCEDAPCCGCCTI
jgi:hypothetical protein